MKTNKISRFLGGALAASALAMATLTSGCFLLAVGAAGAAGAGAVAYAKGELTANLPNAYDAVVNASANAVGQMNFVLINQSKDAGAAVVTARTAEDTHVTISVDRLDNNTSKVRIRVGTFGNETLSRAILDQIKRNL